MDFRSSVGILPTSFPLAALPDDPLILVMAYLQGVYKSPTSTSWSGSQSRNWRNRAKLVITTSQDPEWYKPLGPVSNVNFTNEVFESLEYHLRWTSLIALRLTCKRFAALSARVVPLFSLLRQLRLGYVTMNTNPSGLAALTSSRDAEKMMQKIPFASPTEIRLVEKTCSSTGALKPTLFRGKPFTDQDIKKMQPKGDDDFAPPSSPQDWYGMLATSVHRSFYPLQLPAPHEAPLSALQMVTTAQRHLWSLKQVLVSPVEVSLISNTAIDYFLGGEWKKKLEEDSDTQVRFRLRVALPEDKDDEERPIRWLHFKSIVTQSTSFVRPRTQNDIEKDPLNLSPFFVRKANAVHMRLPYHVGLHILSVETDDAELATALGLPSPNQNCSTIVVMIENGSRGILEPLLRPDGVVFPPIGLQRDDFFLRLAQLLSFPTATGTEARESVAGIVHWLSALSLVDYHTLGTPRLQDLQRMYSYSFLQTEAPCFGPSSPAYIITSHQFGLDIEISRFLGQFLDSDSSSSSSPKSELIPLSPYLLSYYFKSTDLILEQWRRNYIVLPVLEQKAKLELDPSLHDALHVLVQRAHLMDQVEIEFQVLGPPDENPMPLVPVAMYSSFELQTDDPNIQLRFTHRRYPMAISVSIVAPTTLEAWQWATKHCVLLNYFHYGCSPYYVPMPDLSHLSKRYMEVTSVTLLPTVSGAAQPSWTSDPLVTNSQLASTSVNSLEDLESRDGICFFRWDPVMSPDEWRSHIAVHNSYNMPVELHLLETMSAVLGVPELASHELLSLLIRVFGQTMGSIPQASNDNAPFTLPTSRFPKSNASASTPESTSHALVPTHPKSSSPFASASVTSASSTLAPPFGTSRASWTPTLVAEMTAVGQIGEPHSSFVSISMMPQYAHMSPEQLRWADYNLLHPTDFHLVSEHTRSEDVQVKGDAKQPRVHAANLFVDPAVVSQFPRMSHAIHEEAGISYVVFMASGERLILMQLIKSRTISKPRAQQTNSMARTSRLDVPVYPTSDSADDDDSASTKYCVVWRRSQTEWVISSQVTDLARAKTIFSSRFELFTGCPWSLSLHTKGWKTQKVNGRSKWEPERLEIPEQWKQPTFLGQATYCDFVSLEEPVELLRCLVPISDTLRYWSRFYRLVVNDMETSLELIKWSLLNDEPGTEDRVLSLLEYAEWTRTIGDVQGTLEAVKYANLVDTTHPLPWLAKADLLQLASLQTLDPRVEVVRIDQALYAYRRFLHYANRSQTLTVQFNPKASKDVQGELAEDKSSGNGSNGSSKSTLDGGANLLAGVGGGGGGVVVVPGGAGGGAAMNAAAAHPIGFGASSTPSNLAAQTPSSIPTSLSAVMLTRNPLVANIPSVPSLVHMRRARWACGKLHQRLGHYDEAKTCFDELLRKYFKRERLELTLDRCAVLLALGKPKEAAETIDHALKKEIQGSSTSSGHGAARSETTLPPQLSEHTVSLRARAYLILAAAHVRNASLETAVTALREHRRLDPFDPRAVHLEKMIRKGRHSAKPDSRTRLRQHGMQVINLVARGHNVAAAAVAGAPQDAQVQAAVNPQAQNQQGPQLQPVVLEPQVMLDDTADGHPHGLEAHIMPDANMMEVAPMADLNEEDGDDLVGEDIRISQAGLLTSSAPGMQPLSLTSSAQAHGESALAVSSGVYIGNGDATASTSTQAGATTSSPARASSPASSARPSTPPLGSSPVLTSSGSSLLRRSAPHRQYAAWEIFSGLVETMVDYSSMKRVLLPATLFEQDCDSSIVFFPPETLKKAISILEAIRNVIREPKTPSTQTKRTEAEARELISRLEDDYFSTIPLMRRHHISFFISEELRRLHHMLDASFACNLVQKAVAATQAATDLVTHSAIHPPSLADRQAAPFAGSIVKRILNVQYASQQSRFVSAPSLASWHSRFGTYSSDPNYDVPQNTQASVPVKALLDLLAQDATFSLVDRRSSRGQQILNAVGNGTAHSVRIIAIQKTKSIVPPSLPPTSQPSDPSLATLRPPLVPPTLLWIVVPAFSLPRILVEGLSLHTEQDIPSLTFSMALNNHAHPMPTVWLLVEVQLGSVFYCGPDQLRPPPGYDSLAIVKKLTMIREEDGTDLLLPQNADSTAPLFRVFHQSQIGVVRYVVHPNGKE